ncbi:TPA: glycosyltransferase family 2 protein [Streptococcus suis]
MIAFVILHYQAMEETILCVDTIKNMAKEEKKIFIVDNASPNKTGINLREKYSQDSEVIVLLSEKNLGFAQGNNIGYKEARKFSPEFIVVMNNDVFLTQENFYSLLQESHKRYNFDVLGPDIYSTKTNLHQNPQRLSNYSLSELKTARRKLTFKNKFKILIRIKYLLRRTADETASQVEGFDKVQFDKPLHGAAYIFSRNFTQKNENCFYPKTFMYYESYILHYLGTKNGFSFVYDPSIKVIHHEDVATNHTYDDLYKKVVFVNKCLLDSCNSFIELMENEEQIGSI